MKKIFKQFIAVIAVFMITTFLFGACGKTETPVRSENSNESSSGSHKQAENQKEPSKEDTNKTTNSSKKEETSVPIEIIDTVYTNKLVDENDGTVLVEASIIIPKLKNPKNQPEIEKINKYYKNEVETFFEEVKGEGFAAAAENYEDAKKNGYDFNTHMFDRKFHIHYNSNNLLSVLNVQYAYTGGAHPNTFWSAETFDIRSGKKMALTDIFSIPKEEVLAHIYEAVFKQIEQNQQKKENVYNDDYKTAVKEYYEDTDFILTEKGINVFYQLYTLAPYAAGFPEFLLPYDSVKDILDVDISNAHVYNADQDLRYAARELIGCNYIAFSEMFYLNTLPADMPEGGLVDGNTIYPVKDKRFTTFAELEGYVRNTYGKEEADALLSGKTWGGPQYMDKDGKLHVDISKSGGVGYYKKWDTYMFELSDITEDSAKLTVYLKEEDMGTNTLKDTSLSMKMIKEDGLWLLDKMVY
ncbi:DUF3298 and DUF4163 domain-containing protein [Petroclostridium sp. X23]|uniref:DUF3298 and DUF4163 domain-containing protein n=1 Tax=Petroclostridium sp. X23 TaxID=3045146 RepID=UPI0024ADC6A3|nr:DUF3298 and DUF4163 domain-containing protein [Petroclostridium sp. X23]WHH58793.1 DUF3298 and DUF4163 domain-containing protein [Petroclostridium sp. X23]